MKCKRRVRELGTRSIQSYLMWLVEEHDGVAEHFTTPGKIGPPDLLITWPRRGRAADIHFVETKTVGGVLKPWQKRDHARRRKMGCTVVVLWTEEQCLIYANRHG